ncbi:hypothetical protein E2C01_002484 [Portunus trituberculatus]|uniref:Uncharacterized protein n=1 Tax=Portunus trituberculatus TaxID=210409 RepID=A0A5B7CND4_PORTR|nr:hypothetical protein [Portunus trituberculatus]
MDGGKPALISKSTRCADSSVSYAIMIWKGRRLRLPRPGDHTPSHCYATGNGLRHGKQIQEQVRNPVKRNAAEESRCNINT